LVRSPLTLEVSRHFAILPSHVTAEVVELVFGFEVHARDVFAVIGAAGLGESAELLGVGISRAALGGHRVAADCHTGQEVKI
jgi:hypothetical protein